MAKLRTNEEVFTIVLDKMAASVKNPALREVVDFIRGSSERLTAVTMINTALCALDETAKDYFIKDIEDIRPAIKGILQQAGLLESDGETHTTEGWRKL